MPSPSERAGPPPVRITFRQTHGHPDLTPETRALAEEKVQRLARHLDGIDHAELRFGAEGNPRIADNTTCEVTIHAHGHILRATAAAADVATATDRTVEKLEHRIAKLKGRVLGRSHRGRPRQLDSPPDRASAHGAVDHADENHARIVKTKQFAIKPMTPEDAALQMELLGHDFFLFTNAETHKAAVVYRRGDGDTGLIDAT